MKGKFKVQDDKMAFMPAFFTPTNEYLTGPISRYYDIQKLSLVFETDIEKLAQYIPEELEITSNRIAIVKIENKEVEVFANRPYDLLCVVAFVRYEDENGPVDGVYSLIMWENMIEPCIFGREAFGVPKLLCDLDPIQKVGDDYYVTASANGTTFLKIKAHLPDDMPQASIDALNANHIESAINLRHLPQPDLYGKTYEDLVLYKTDNLYTHGKVGTGEVEWIVPAFHEFPGQQHIIQGLADLPLTRFVSASLTHKEFSYILMKEGRILKVL